MYCRLFGNNVDEFNLFDWKQTCITSELKCSAPSFRKFIDFCFHPNADAEIAIPSKEE